jgi:rubrerythrin
MFTLADICSIAVQIEKNGEESYRGAARIAKDPEVAGILNWMAAEEKCHCQWFEGLSLNRPLSAEQRKMAEMGKTLLQEMVRGNPFLLDQSELEDAGNLLEVITRSQVFEQDTILFYEFLLALIDDQDTADHLRRIIEEERNHLGKLARLAEKFRPDQTLGTDARLIQV